VKRSDSKRPSDQELKDIVDGKGIEPGGTNIPLIQAMAKELLEARAHKAMCIHCECNFCKTRPVPGKGPWQ
jgi:hypothetical protein